jgi:hypothetical protein
VDLVDPVNSRAALKVALVRVAPARVGLAASPVARRVVPDRVDPVKAVR